MDTRTGDVLHEFYLSAADEELLAEALSSLSVGPWKPAASAWPLTDTPPQGEIVTGDSLYLESIVSYRRPDSRFGFFAGNSDDEITVHTCQSEMVLNRATGEIKRADIAPDEQEIFDRFVSEISEPIEIEPKYSIEDYCWAANPDCP